MLEVIETLEIHCQLFPPQQTALRSRRCKFLVDITLELRSPVALLAVLAWLALHVSQAAAALWGLLLSRWVTEAQGGRAKPQESVHSSFLDMVYVTSAYTLLATVHSTDKPTDSRQEYTLPSGKHGKRAGYKWLQPRSAICLHSCGNPCRGGSPGRNVTTEKVSEDTWIHSFFQWCYLFWLMAKFPWWYKLTIWVSPWIPPSFLLVISNDHPNLYYFYFLNIPQKPSLSSHISFLRSPGFFVQTWALCNGQSNPPHIISGSPPCPKPSHRYKNKTPYPFMSPIQTQFLLLPSHAFNI